MITACNLHDVLRGDVSVQGRGVFVDRLWPRGVSKEEMEWEWLKSVAPTTDLRKWFGHEPAKWEEFQQRYRAELGELLAAGDAGVEKLLGWADGDLTLLYGAADRELNHAHVLAEWLTEQVAAG